MGSDVVPGPLDGAAEHHAEDHPKDLKSEETKEVAFYGPGPAGPPSDQRGQLRVSHHDDADADADSTDDVQFAVKHLLDGAGTALRKSENNG